MGEGGLESVTDKTAIDCDHFLDSHSIGAFQIAIFAICGALMFLDGFDTQMISYVAPHIGREWRLSHAMLGWVLSTTLVGLMIGYVLVAPLAARFGHKKVVVASTIIFGIFTLLTVPARDVDWLIATRIISGIGLGSLAPSAIALVSDYCPRRLRASSVIFTYCFFSLGFIAAGLVSAWLIPSFGWRSMFVAGGIAPFLLLPVIIAYLRNPIPFVAAREGAEPAVAIMRRIDPAISMQVEVIPVEASTKTPMRELFGEGRTGATLTLWLIYALNLGVFYALQSWLPTILTELGRGSRIVVVTTALSTGGGIAISFIMGPAMDRFGAYSSLVILYAVGGACMAFLASALGFGEGILFAASFLAGCCVSGGQKAIIALTAIFYRADLRSTGIGWGLAVGRVGGILGPITIGALLQAHLTYGAALLALAIPMPLMAALVWFLRRRYHRDYVLLT